MLPVFLAEYNEKFAKAPRNLHDEPGDGTRRLTR
jgi:hypothetical protein